ncbi:hypothetical protein ATEIFO6365_0013004900 [Aspergillus terreus]|uniref:Uncharacterized protein n=1 Tax=Aspergillus terreus TaxID=33178 RepID=A0A5M3ZFP8_ASPTE|nr:hypothetical protein ATETN484_0014004900 [Aspergillus terreus]GFF20715.1 hypothetical protein ATEIFO6365_0013004900 [Aspergillus terreus]
MLIGPELRSFDTVSSELLRHFDSGVASKLAWVDGPSNPWRHIILPLSHISPTVLSSVLAIAAQDLAYKYTPDHPYPRRLRTVSFHYLGQALSSLRQQLGALRRTPGAAICPSQARCLLASTLLLYNLELLTPEAARWQLHIQGARAIIQEAIRCPNSLEEADVFLFYEYYYACVFIGLTTFDPTDGTPNDIPTHDRITIFSDFVRITHSVTQVERVKFTTGSNPQTLQLEDVKEEIEVAKQRTLHLSQAIQFSSPAAQRDFAHLTCMYYHASLIYSQRVLADDVSSQEDSVQASREAILEHLENLTQRTNYAQDLVWPLFIAGTECRALPEKQGMIERAMIDVMRVSGSLDRRRVLSFLQMFWRQDVDRVPLGLTLLPGDIPDMRHPSRPTQLNPNHSPTKLKAQRLEYPRKMSFQTTREKTSLLIPTKQALTKPKSKTLQPNARPAHNPIQATTTTTTTTTTTDPAPRASTVEYDFSRIPQPFLDPPLWENMKTVDRLRGEDSKTTAGDFEAKERAELERRRRERDAEFGGMAVRERRRVR